MKRYKLKIYDGHTALKGDFHFIRSLFRGSGKALLLVLFVIVSENTIGTHFFLNLGYSPETL